MTVKPFPQEPSDSEIEKIDIPHPSWTPGQGAGEKEWSKHPKVEVDPYHPGRAAFANYRLLVSGVLPRPIALVSTVDKDGVRNLAPFSYFQVVNSDPPMFVLGCSTGKGGYKDTCKNILETEECVINLISEWYVEAANYTNINAPSDVDEWKLSGLTPTAASKVKAPVVAESAFSIECKLNSKHTWNSKTDPERMTGMLLILEGVNFHIREDIINEERDFIDVSKFKPVSRLGGNAYGRTTQTYDLPRVEYKPPQN